MLSIFTITGIYKYIVLIQSGVYNMYVDIRYTIIIRDEYEFFFFRCLVCLLFRIGGFSSALKHRVYRTRAVCGFLVFPPPPPRGIIIILYIITIIILYVYEYSNII